ncbi:MAG: hypothetical protein CSA20_05475 [Deltaproteobacteria bacterium]|nr:MAG: hypothetical protein CSB23_03375 [Deltaproteobacteria bacterium]PIE72918.1 MAG: hypothetical protein CSA20_05475 [Deltaproteobacteria bacterium]
MNVSFLREVLLFDYVYSRLRRSLLKWVGLSFLFILITFCYGSLFFFADVLEQNAERWLAMAPDVVVQMQRGGRQVELDPEMLQTITALRGVADGKGRLWGYYYDSRTRTAYTVIAPEETDLKPDEAIVGQGIVRLWQLEPGDRLALYDVAGKAEPFRIVSFFPPETEMATADLLQVSPEAFRRLFQMPSGMVTDVGLTVPQSLERVNVAQKIKELYPSSRVIIREDLQDTYTMIFGWRSSIFLIVSLSGLVALLTFAIDQLSGLWSGERQEIALLRCLGWTTTMVVRCRLYEVGVVVLFSWLWGVVLAWCHIFLFGGGLISQILRGWSTIFPEGGFLPMLDFGSLGLLFCITVIPLIAVALLPIWKISNVDPGAF